MRFRSNIRDLLRKRLAVLQLKEIVDTPFVFIKEIIDSRKAQDFKFIDFQTGNCFYSERKKVQTHFNFLIYFQGDLFASLITLIAPKYFLMRQVQDTRNHN